MLVMTEAVSSRVFFPVNKKPETHMQAGKFIQIQPNAAHLQHVHTAQATSEAKLNLNLNLRRSLAGPFEG
jgi:hypothetical protein